MLQITPYKFGICQDSTWEKKPGLLSSEGPPTLFEA